MSQMQVDTHELVNAGNSIRKTADGLDADLHSLQGRVDSLLNSGWSGPAADAFRRDWEEWLDGARNVIGGLDTESALLISNGQTYDTHEGATTDGINAAGGPLNLAG